jgi:hypothetical protein
MPTRTETKKQAPPQLRLLLAATAIGPLLLASSPGRAESSQIDRKCAVFSSVSDRAGCACALQHGGRVTEVHGRWRWFYPRPHQERHCHGQISGLSLKIALMPIDAEA